MPRFHTKTIIPAEERAALGATTLDALHDYSESLNDLMAGDLVGLFADLTGERRTNRSRKDAYFRANQGNDNIRVVLSGRKRGHWYDERDQRGGKRPISAVMHYLGLTFRGALDWVADRFGRPRFDGAAVYAVNAEKAAREREERKRARAEKEAADAAAQRLTDEKASADVERDYWRNAVPVDGTPGEIYLSDARGLGAATWPDSVRWHPRERALVFAVTNAEGAIVGAQIVAVTKDGRKDSNRFGKAGAKLSRGPIGLGSVKFPGDPNGPILFAEGPETGLTLWLATGFETRVVLGVAGFKRIANEAPRGRKIIVCRDDDAIHMVAYRNATAGLHMLADAGFDVWDAWPFAERRQSGADFNDLLLEHGFAAVKTRIEEALADQGKSFLIERPHDEAKALVEAHVAKFFNDALAFARPAEGVTFEAPSSSLLMPVRALGVDVGGGKTHAYIVELVRYLATLRAIGDRRVGVIAVPEHKLSSEARIRLRAEIERVGAPLQEGVWRGRGALKGNAKHERDLMCEKYDESVADAEMLLVNIEKEICRTCPHRPKNGGSCQYILQGGLTDEIDVWIVAHAALKNQPPKPIADRRIAALVIDEDVVATMTDDAISIPIDQIATWHVPEGEDGYDLLDYRYRLTHALGSVEDGFLPRSALSLPGYEINPELADAAPGMEWDRKITRKQKRVWRDRVENQTIRPAHAIASAIRALGAEREDGEAPPEISGLIRMGRDEKGVRVVMVGKLARISEEWFAPTLFADANHWDVGLLNFVAADLWSIVEDLGHISIEAPHRRVLQVVDKSYSIGWLAKRANRRKVAAAIWAIHRRNGGKTLVVGNKDVVEKLGLPAQKDPAKEGLHIEHFGAIAGLDGYGDARTVIVLGRPKGSPRSYEMKAGALTGAAPTVLAQDPGAPIPWFSRTKRIRLKRLPDGSVVKVPCEGDGHPDELVDRLLWHLCVTAIDQAQGRGRPSRRTADAPLDVYILTNDPLPFPVDEFLLAEDLEPTLAELQIAEGGVAFAEGAAASKAYPDIWETGQAFKDAKRREAENPRFGITESQTRIYNNTRMRPCDPETANLPVAFQLSGARRKIQGAVYDPEVCPDPRAFIEQKLGELAAFEVLR